MIKNNNKFPKVKMFSWANIISCSNKRLLQIDLLNWKTISRLPREIISTVIERDRERQTETEKTEKDRERQRKTEIVCMRVQEREREAELVSACVCL